MSKIRLIFILLFSSILFSVQAQTIKRWTFSSLGKLGYISNSNKDTIMVEYTFGQCPGCNVLIGGSTFLRQGFQQPLIDIKKPVDTTKTNGGGGGSTGLPPCSANDPASKFNIDFTSSPKLTTCGTYFDFEYTGDVIQSMKFAWDFTSSGVPRYSSNQNPEKIGFTTQGVKFVRLEAGTTCYKSITKPLDVTVNAFVAQAKVGAEINCKGEKNSSIDLSVFGGTAPYKYQWSNSSTTANLNNIGAGTYSYTVTDFNDCVFSSDATIIEPKDSLKVKIAVKDETCKGTKDGQLILNVKGGTPGYEFFWADSVNTKDRLNLSVGLYNVTITDDNGCMVKATGEVKLFCDKTGKDFPNTFTPNDDGINDGWEFPGIDDFPNNKVEVFNRWGQLLYNKTGYKSGEWKGLNSDGEPLPSGPYYYVVYLNDRDKTVFSGAVTIIR